MHPLLRPMLLAFTCLSIGLCNAANKPSASPITLRLLCSSGFIGAAQAIAPGYEKISGLKLEISSSPNRGMKPTHIPERAASLERFDLVLTDGASMDKLVAQRRVKKMSRVDLGQSFIAMAVRKGAEKPKIDTVEALRNALMSAESVAYSSTPSGVYLSHWLFPHMDLDRSFVLKSKAIPGEPVGNAVARGDAQLGFQQLSELKPIPGIDIVGLIPDKVQQMVLYSGAVVKDSPHTIEAEALLNYMKSLKGRDALEQSGLRPLP